MAVKCFAAVLSEYNFVYFSLNFISATTFVPHLINSRASWNIKPVVIWLHYYDNRPSYENWLHVCFCFETSAGCIANYTVVLFNYWINIRRESQVELLFTDTTTYQVRFCLAHLSSFTLNFHWSPSLFKPQLNIQPYCIALTIPQSQKVIQTDRQQERERKRRDRDYWHRMSHLPSHVQTEHTVAF